MKKVINKIIIIILVTILTIGTLLILSNNIQAAEDTLREVYTTKGLAKFILTKPADFMKASIHDIFRLNIRSKGSPGLSVANTKTEEEIGYNSAACIFHTQSSSPDGYRVKITNIIDIETPGTVNVYKFKGITSSTTVQYTTGTSINCSSGDAGKDIAAFTYLLYKSNQQGTTNSSNNKYNAYKKAIEWCWKSSVGAKSIRDYMKTSGALDDYFYTGSELSGDFSSNEIKAAYKEAEQLIKNPTLSKVTTSPSVTYKSGKAYIGPLKVNCSGGTTTIQINNGTDWVAVDGWVTKNNDGTFGTIQKGTLTNNAFYIVTNESNVKNLEDINAKVVLTYKSYKARILLATNKESSGQNLMFYRGDESTGTKEVTWEVEQTKKVSIQKQDASGSALKIAGIEFEVYDSNNKKIGTLTTDANGKTNSINLTANASYKIIETVNTVYGYKNLVISSATLTQGTGTITVSDGEATFTLTADSTISIKNTKDLGKLVVEKKNEEGNAQEGVKFALYQAVETSKGYIKLYYDSEFVSEITESIDITDYDVQYTSSISSATKFVTDEDGKIEIENLEKYKSKGQLYNYYLKECTNTNYGYKALSSTAKYSAGDEITVKTNGDIPFNLDTTNSTTTIEVINQPELASLELLKVDSDGETALENVAFKIKIKTENDEQLENYLQLYDVNGFVEISKGEITINKNNLAEGSQYSVKYVTNEDKATIFTTNEEGKIVINNLEIDESKNIKYTYSAYEIYNPNYGYSAEGNVEQTATIKELKLGELNQIKLKNTRALGNLTIRKFDKWNPKILLEDVGFAVEISSNVANKYAYLALYDQNGELVQSIRDTATINEKNKADDTEYRVEYYYTDKPYRELTAEQKSNITIFLTGEEGLLTINNLEIYSNQNTQKYTYKLIETSNANYGYDIDSTVLDGITLESETTIKELSNNPIYTKVSGYVWIDKIDGKGSTYDGIYTEGNKDQKLKNLYIVEDEKLVKNPNAEIKVEIKLRNNKTGEIIKSLPDEYDAETGKYTFVDVKLSEIEDYEVIFIYDGFYYTTVLTQLDKENGSKVKEVVTEREKINNEFATIKEGNEVISANSKNTVEYAEEVHKKEEDGKVVYQYATSTVSKLRFDTTITGTTNEAGYSLKERYDTLKLNSTVPIDTLDNVNMGIVLREQPKLAIGSDIYSAYVEVNGKGYTYNYNGRQAHYNDINNDEIGVKFEQENTINRYTRTVYSSDVEALENGTTSMKVNITYKIQLFNQANTLTSKIYQIKNYYDSSYTIEAIGANYDEVSPIKKSAEANTSDVFTVVETEENIEAELGEGVEESSKSYNSARISLNGEAGIELKAKESKDIYIRFNISTEAIKGLLNKNSTYHNATEIMSYSTHYGEKTKEMMNISDETEVGKLYAGIDKSSQPGNIKLKLIKADGTPILDTSGFEDDTTSAPSLLLESREARKISGTVWEDSTTYTDENGRLGDGIFNEGNERIVSGVIVTLYNVQTNEIATYSDGKTLVQTITDEKGNYTLGYYDEAKKKYLGILPGEYIIKYTYGTIENENPEEIKSYIINAENGNIYVNPNDYKSTIISSESKVLKEAFEKNEDLRWYIKDEGKRYSDARDDITLRAEYRGDIEQNSFTITNSTYNDLAINNMYAYTPTIEVPIEFTEKDESVALKEDNSPFELEKEFGKVDFGISERARVDIIIDKNITGLEIISQTGANIVSKGNPSDLNSIMQYVKKLDDIVSVEIESDMLQGAQLNLEYSITLKNNSEMDYLDEEYYYYGKNGATATTTKVKKVIDYLDSTLELDEEQNEEGIWKNLEISDLTGYVNTKLINEKLNSGDYHILLTTAFDGLTTGEEKTVKLYAHKALATSNSVVESNGVEIIEISGVRIITGSLPGNYDPSSEDNEKDEDKVDLVITPPTGIAINYTVYIITAVATFVILLLGIVIIKKKVVK